MSSRSPIKFPQAGLLEGLGLRIRLVLRLLADSRVNPFVKLLPIGSVVYLFFPDLLPGPVDDALIIWLATTFFVELCPPEVVQEHMAQLQPQNPPVKPPEAMSQQPPSTGEVLEGEFYDVNQPPKS
ncbi:MAG: hypothetical protein LDL12_05520 [Anaerolinea sp.]|nr:hypothetical protein [Anaerolinea sp.]